MVVNLQKESTHIPSQESEQLSAPETEQVVQPAVQEAVGYVAAHNEAWPQQTAGWGSETVNEHLRTVEVDGKQVETDLPEGVDIMFVAASPKRPSIPIKEVDKLPAGKFTLYDKENRAFTRGNITITDYDGSKRINHLETTIPVFGLRRIGEGAQNLMEDLGFKVSEGDWPVESPTPDTLKSKAAKFGVDVKFFSDTNLIPAYDYLNTFKNGQYPVALGSGEYYAHDISDDHITAMIFGGEELKDALATAASLALEQDKVELMGDAAYAIDRYTATLRGVMNPKGLESGGPRTEYMPANGRKYFHRIGVGLGISTEVSDHIIAVAQVRASEHGIPVQELA